MTGGTLRASTSVRVTGQLSNGAKFADSDPHTAALTYGTTSGKADIILKRDRTLAGGASETLDLYTGSTLLDLFDATTPLRKIKFISVSIASGGDTSGLQIGGANTDAWPGFFADASDKAKIFPDGPPYLGGSPAGVAVGAATKNLKVENLGAASTTYTLIIAGTSV